MRTESFTPKVLSICLGAALLGGCQANTQQTAGPPPLQFEITDIGNPSHPAPTTAPSGAEIDMPAVFDIEVRLVGADPASVQDLQTITTSYTPECNGRPVAEPYRTKVIVYPYGVTAAPATPTSPGFKLPLSSRTLMELGLCTPRAPLTGSVHLQARMLDSNSNWSSSDLTIHVNPLPAEPSKGG